MAESGVLLYTIELALRDRHHELQQTTEMMLLKLRSEAILWHKEALLNIAVSRFDPAWHYGAWIDADFIMTRPDWATEAIHELQKFSWVQLYATYADMLPDHSIGAWMPSFMNVLHGGGQPAGYYAMARGALWGAPGGAWAFRREAFDATGGLLDCCILGSGDYHMAVALAGDPNVHREHQQGTPGYAGAIDSWAQRARLVRGNVGMIQNAALHLWHGKRANRGYVSRSQILRDHAYDPGLDISKDWQGVLRFNQNKPGLEHAVRDYFAARKEDEVTL